MFTAEFFPLGIGMRALSTSSVTLEVKVFSTQFILLFEARGALGSLGLFWAWMAQRENAAAARKAAFFTLKQKFFFILIVIGILFLQHNIKNRVLGAGRHSARKPQFVAFARRRGLVKERRV